MDENIEVVKDHTIIAFDPGTSRMMKVHDGDYAMCKILVDSLAPKYPDIRLYVVDKDLMPVYGVRVMKIDLKTVAVVAALILAVVGWVMWG